MPRRPQLRHLLGPASSAPLCPPAEPSHTSRQRLAHPLHFPNWRLSSRHRKLFWAWEDGNQSHSLSHMPGLAPSELRQPAAISPLSHLESNSRSPAELGQQPELLPSPHSSSGLPGSEVKGLLVKGIQRGAEKVGTREAGHGMKGKSLRGKARAEHRLSGRCIGERSRYTPQPTCWMCRKCNYFWKSP